MAGFNYTALEVVIVDLHNLLQEATVRRAASRCTYCHVGSSASSGAAASAFKTASRKLLVADPNASGQVNCFTDLVCGCCTSCTDIPGLGTKGPSTDLIERIDVSRAEVCVYFFPKEEHLLVERYSVRNRL